VVKQALLALLGIALMVVLMMTDYRAFGRVAPFLYGLGLLLLVAVLLVGDESLGSRRWLSLGPVQVQASELAKPSPSWPWPATWPTVPWICAACATSWPPWLWGWCRRCW